MEDLRSRRQQVAEQSVRKQEGEVGDEMRPETQQLIFRRPAARR
jgi:hypothetical protein